MQNDHGFNKYHLQKKLIFRQLLTKIANLPILGAITAYANEKKNSQEMTNFTDFRRNGRVFIQKILY